jgi:O-antigen/teichoic acid export membrane protein
MICYLSLAVYLGLERIRAYNLIDLALQGIIVINAVATLAVLGFGLNELVVVGTVANVVAGVVIALLLARSMRRGDGQRQLNVGLLREMLRYGLRFLVALAASTIILRGDLLIVNYFRGSGEAGVYAVSTQAATLLQMMPAVISTILFPRAASKQDATGAVTCRVTRHAVLIMFMVCLAAVPASFLLPVLYGPAFSAVPVLFLIMLPGVFLLGIETIQVQHFTGLGLPRTIPAYWLATMAVSVGLNIWLVPRFGASAAATVSSISYALMFILVAGYFSSRTGRGFSEMFIVRRGELAAFINAFVGGEGKA